MSCDCCVALPHGAMGLPHGAMGLSAVCDCGISCSYSLKVLQSIEWNFFSVRDIRIDFDFEN